MTIDPPPEKANPEEMDELLNQELSKFNEYYMQLQANKGAVDPSPLIGVERGAVKAYLMYASTEREDDDG